MLTANQLSIMRAAQARALPEACTVWSAADTADTTGGVTRVWSSIETTVCRVGKTGKPGELAIAERAGVVTPYTVTLPYSSAVTAGNQVRALSRIFHVVGVLRGSWDTAARAVCEEEK